MNFNKFAKTVYKFCWGVGYEIVLKLFKGMYWLIIWRLLHISLNTVQNYVDGNNAAAITIITQWQFTPNIFEYSNSAETIHCVLN